MENIPAIDFRKLKFPLSPDLENVIKVFMKHKGYKSTDNNFQIIRLSGKLWTLVEKILRNDIRWPTSVPAKKQVPPNSVSCFKMFQCAHASEQDKIEFLQKVRIR